MRLLALTALIVAPVLAAPARAQDAPFCGGISLVGEWVGGDADGSDAMAPEALFDFEGRVPIAGHMVRMFTMSQAGEIRIDVAAIPSGDPYIALYDEGGTEVGADDDSGGDFAASLTTGLQPGTYCLAARSYESGVTDVSVQIGRPDFFSEPAPEVPVAPQATDGAGCESPEVGLLTDGPLSAADLDDAPAVTGSAGATPGLAFTLAEAAPLAITAESEAGDPVIRLLDPSGEVLAENDDSEGLNSRIAMAEPLAAGEYCIELEDLNGPDNTITVTLQAFDPVAERLRRLAAMEFAPASSDPVEITDLGPVATSVSADLVASSDASWFAFDMAEGGLLLIEAVGDEVDTEIRLFDRLGREVAYNDDGPEGLDSFIVQRTQPGGYLLGVRVLDEGGRGTVRLLLERYVRAQ